MSTLYFTSRVPAADRQLVRVIVAEAAGAEPPGFRARTTYNGGCSHTSAGMRMNLSNRWVQLASGIIGVIAGLVIVFKWPLSGLWVFGLVVGLDLLFHGAWWVASGWTARES